MSKLVKPTALIVGVIMVVLLSVSYASAQESTYPPIVQRLAQKFNLNESDIQAVFDEERDERFAEIQARWQERLDDLVSEGKITEEQKKAIIAKHEEIHNKMIETKDMDPEDRRETMQALRDDFKKWAEEQGIDTTFLGPFAKGYGMGFKKGFHRGYMMGAD